MSMKLPGSVKVTERMLWNLHTLVYRMQHVSYWLCILWWIWCVHLMFVSLGMLAIHFYNPHRFLDLLLTQHPNWNYNLWNELQCIFHIISGLILCIVQVNQIPNNTFILVIFLILIAILECNIIYSFINPIILYSDVAQL